MIILRIYGIRCTNPLYRIAVDLSLHKRRCLILSFEFDSFCRLAVFLESVQSRYLDGRAVMNCGEATAAEIDAEVMEMLKAAYEEAKRLLRENREALDKISEFLIEKETITGKEFMKILRKVQGIEESEEPETKKEARIAMKPVEEPAQEVWMPEESKDQEGIKESEEGPEFTEE